ncbi:MAG: peptidylprolyl isomerase [Candidatus Gastranaerophilales bacterium]|nr:peptidylprolyl isomerase [Candidatus Gastranaerophilales bacterium]
MGKFFVEEEINKIKNNVVRRNLVKEIKKQILIQDYIEKFEINILDKNMPLEECVSSFCQKRNIKNQDELRIFLFENKFTKQEFEEFVIYEEMIENLKEKIISQDDINKLFLDKKSKYDSVIFSVIKVENAELAKEIFFQITKNNESFENLAIKHSIGKESANGGFVGKIPLSGLNPRLKNKLVFLNENEVTEPFLMDEKYFIIAKLIKVDRLEISDFLNNKLKTECFYKWLDKQVQLLEMT